MIGAKHGTETADLICPRIYQVVGERFDPQ
jgi:hypothetical protein